MAEISSQFKNHPFENGYACMKDSKFQDDETEDYAEAIELQGFRDQNDFGDLFAPDSLADDTSSVSETSSPSSSLDEDEREEMNPIQLRNLELEEPMNRDRIASFDRTTTCTTDSWNVDRKQHRAVVLARFAQKPKPAPQSRRNGVFEMARFEHEKRMEIMQEEWAMKKRLLDMKLRAAEMKFEAYRWRAEYYELAAKRRFYFNHCQQEHDHYNEHG